eukprot:gnl/Dysnectes_brevis/388_a430_4626.p1 GENE.gnl/Dysnectes_brevis/388_a430_4626~~gnl/Dysnectes_brevis/388_a430_4626.p1  ORF type:complete len:283 (-),score=111.94 gnl/Dysnectes_brevis/388_a430_4626:70-918(-)
MSDSPKRPIYKFLLLEAINYVQPSSKKGVTRPAIIKALTEYLLIENPSSIQIKKTLKSLEEEEFVSKPTTARYLITKAGRAELKKLMDKSINSNYMEYVRDEFIEEEESEAPVEKKTKTKTSKKKAKSSDTPERPLYTYLLLEAVTYGRRSSPKGASRPGTLKTFEERLLVTPNAPAFKRALAKLEDAGFIERPSVQRFTVTKAGRSELLKLRKEPVNSAWMEMVAEEAGEALPRAKAKARKAARKKVEAAATIEVRVSKKKQNKSRAQRAARRDKLRMKLM